MRLRFTTGTNLDSGKILHGDGMHDLVAKKFAPAVDADDMSAREKGDVKKGDGGLNQVYNQLREAQLLSDAE